MPPLLTASPSAILRAAYCWPALARAAQVEPPGDWRIWLIMTGRGWGKTRTACEAIRKWANATPGMRLHLVARTAADARDTMIEGESGLLSVCAGDLGNVPRYNPSKRSVEWPNGSKALLFSAETPNQLRGPQCAAWWADEVAAWQYITDTWDNLQLGARLGQHVRGIVTTTPRPVPLLRSLIDRADVHVTRGHTADNAANLAPSFMASIADRYEGTRLGRQELAGEILDDNPRALWRRATLDDSRVSEVPEMWSIVVAIDPAATSKPDSDETGIVVAGAARDGHYYVLADRSIRGTPHAWATAAVAAYEANRANVLVYESNQGGEMVAQTIRAVNGRVPLVAVHATRGKALRAEPVAALYEQGRVHHVGFFPELEDQLCEWDPTQTVSPDRLDALVWAITRLQQSAGGGFR